MNQYKLSLITTVPIIVIVGYFGFLLFRKIKMPAPGLTGALVANAVITALGVQWAVIPIEFNIFLQTLIGIMIGSQFNKEKVKQIKSLAFPSLLVGTWMTVVGLGLGYLISIISDIDIGTALFSAVPGGMSEMSALALMYGLNVPIVVLFQFLRIIMIYFSVPIIASRLNKNKVDVNEVSYACGVSTNVLASNEYNIIFTILIGIAAGFAAWAINIPGGAIIGSLVAVGGLRSYGIKLKTLPKKMIICAQIGLGASLGLTFTPQIAKSLTSMLGITFLFSFLIVINSLILGYVFHRLFKVDIITSLLSCAAAGVSQMSSIALDMDADAVIVSLIQSMRLVSIVIILPPIILLIM